MIASLTGQIVARQRGQVVIDVAGVGYQVFVTDALSQSMADGQNTTLHTALIVREDANLLFGFAAIEERRIFDTLRSVNGVGPKLALSILNVLGIDQIANAVATQDDRVFSSVSGIGAKTAKMLVVSLEGKLISSTATKSTGLEESVILALVGLGWREKDALEAINTLQRLGNQASSEKDLLRQALSLLANDRAQTRTGS